MTKAGAGVSLRLVEPAEHLLAVLDGHKTTAAFPVLSSATGQDEPGDFVGIISRAR